MVKTFNPPPNWPTPPPGWVPSSRWQPDPSWGPAPDGWTLWHDDDSRASLDEILAATTLRTDQQRLRRRALAQYVIASVCALLAGIAAYKAVHDDDGGRVWVGGFLLAAGLGFRARRNFRLAGHIGHPMSTINSMALGVAGVLALIPTVMTGLVLTGVISTGDSTAKTNTATTGPSLYTCWTALDASGNTYQVACSRPEAKLIGVAETSTPERTCADIYVETTPSRYLCLSPR